MTALVTAAEAKARGVGLDLADADLQELLDREEAEIVRRFGPNYPGPQTDEAYPRERFGRNLYLTRAATSVTSITEYVSIGDTAPTTRASTDYYLWPGEGRIEAAYGAQGFGARCTVVYVPIDDTDLRREVILDLVRAATDAASLVASTVSGLGYTISGGRSSSARTTARDAREAAYSRLGWLS